MQNKNELNDKLIHFKLDAAEEVLVEKLMKVRAMLAEFNRIMTTKEEAFNKAEAYAKSHRTQNEFVAEIIRDIKKQAESSLNCVLDGKHPTLADLDWEGIDDEPLTLTEELDIIEDLLVEAFMRLKEFLGDEAECKENAESVAQSHGKMPVDETARQEMTDIIRRFKLVKLVGISPKEQAFRDKLQFAQTMIEIAEREIKDPIKTPRQTPENLQALINAIQVVTTRIDDIRSKKLAKETHLSSEVRSISIILESMRPEKPAEQSAGSVALTPALDQARTRVDTSIQKDKRKPEVK